MRQSVVYKDASRKGKYLGLVLQTSERSGENQPVVVALEFGTVFFPCFVEKLQSEAFVRYQLFPVHAEIGCFCKLNEKINTEIEEQINVELTEYVKKQEASYKKQCEKIVKDYNKALFEYEVECKKNVQNVKNIIKKELKEEVKRKLQIFTEKEEYLQYLIKTINDSLNVVNNDNSSIIFVTNNDKQKYEEVLNRYNIKIDVLDNDFIGGCKLKNDKLGVIIDNTLKTNLDEI